MTKLKGRKGGQSKPSLGIFTNFPTIVHGTGEAFHKDPLHKVQRATILALKELNNYRERYPLSVSGQSGTYIGTLGFEIGIADDLFFNYLDDETVQKLCKPLHPRRKYHLLDFLIIVTYHYTQQKKRIALNFDHFHLRLLFDKRRVEGRLFHNKGTRRISLDEVLNRVFNQISKNMMQSSLGTLTVKRIKTH
jgi:hypothetical protein